MIHMFDRRDLFGYSSYTHWPGDQYDSDTWYLVYPYRRTAVNHVTGWHLYQVPRTYDLHDLAHVGRVRAVRSIHNSCTHVCTYARAGSV